MRAPFTGGAIGSPAAQMTRPGHGNDAGSRTRLRASPRKSAADSGRNASPGATVPSSSPEAAPDGGRTRLPASRARQKRGQAKIPRDPPVSAGATTGGDCQFFRGVVAA